MVDLLNVFSEQKSLVTYRRKDITNDENLRKLTIYQRQQTLLLFSVAMSYKGGQSFFSASIWAASFNFFKAGNSSNIQGKIICSSKKNQEFIH